MQLSVSQRNAKYVQIKQKYPERLPVICLNGPNCRVLERNKYLVPEQLTVAEFIFVIRQRLGMNKNHALMLLCNNYLLRATDTMVQVHRMHSTDIDGYLYITYVKENTFGNL